MFEESSARSMTTRFKVLCLMITMKDYRILPGFNMCVSLYVEACESTTDTPSHPYTIIAAHASTPESHYLETYTTIPGNNDINQTSTHVCPFKP